MSGEEEMGSLQASPFALASGNSPNSSASSAAVAPLTFKSPFRSDMTVDVLDVLSALETWARMGRRVASHSFTYGELEIGARMAREALAAGRIQPQDTVTLPKLADGYEWVAAPVSERWPAYDEGGE